MMDAILQAVAAVNDFAETDPAIFAALAVCSLLVLFAAMIVAALWPMADEVIVDRREIGFIHPEARQWER